MRAAPWSPQPAALVPAVPACSLMCCLLDRTGCRTFLFWCAQHTVLLPVSVRGLASACAAPYSQQGSSKAGIPWWGGAHHRAGGARAHRRSGGAGGLLHAAQAQGAQGLCARGGSPQAGASWNTQSWLALSSRRTACPVSAQCLRIARVPVESRTGYQEQLVAAPESLAFCPVSSKQQKFCQSPCF